LLRLPSDRTQPSPIRHTSRQRHAHPLYRVGLPLEYLEKGVLAVPPEVDVEAPRAEPQIGQLLSQHCTTGR
jgi:hypothetical protein